MGGERVGVGAAGSYTVGLEHGLNPNKDVSMANMYRALVGHLSGH